MKLLPRLSLVSITLALMIGLFIACQKPQPEVKQTALSPVEAPQADQALVTFLSGDVTHAASSQWEAVEIGHLLKQEESLKVGPESYCELQFGKMGSLRIQADTLVLLKDVCLLPQGGSVGVKMAVGSVLAKVSKLQGGEKFNIETGAAVCGVRGTEFGVWSDQDGTTHLAVREGKVVVLPSQVDPAALREKASSQEQLNQAVEKIENASPVVASNQELTITADSLKESAAALKQVEQAVAKIAETSAGKPVSQESLAGLDTLVEATAQKLQHAVAPPQELSARSIEELKGIDKIKLVEITVLPAAAAPAQAPEVPLEKYSFQVSPEEAEILIDGDVAGKGRFSGLFAHGQTLKVRFSRPGYEEQQLSVNVAKNSGRLYEVVLKKSPGPKERISIRTSPADAQISMKGKVLASGEYSGEFEVGESLEFTVSRQDFEPQTLKIEVAAGAGKLYEVGLKEQERSVSLRAVPADADILLEGKLVGRGSFDGSFAASRRLEFLIRREGYAEKTLSLAVAQAASAPYEIRLEELRREIRLQALPADAQISLNGRVVGKGSFAQSYPFFSKLEFSITGEGYQPQELKVEVREGNPSTYLVSLQGLVFSARSRVSEASITGNILIAGERIYMADRAGVVFALNRQGKTLWTVPTRNAPNENCSPVLIGPNLYLSGSDEFVIVNAQNGSVITRMGLEKEYSHIFGRRIVAYKQTALFPTNRSLRLIDLYTGESMKEIAVPQGSRMTPALYNGKALIVNQEGILCIIDPASGALETQIVTDAVQPVAVKITVFGDRAYFGDRKGRLVCVDLLEKRVLWERVLKKDRERGIYQDLEIGKDGVFAFAEGTLYGFSLGEGTELFRPLAGVACPPLYREEEGRLYFGSEAGSLVVADTGGRTLKQLALGARVTARPVYEGGNLILGTDAGEVIVIRPELIP